MDQVEQTGEEMPHAEWYVIYCDDDDSHTIVADQDVMYARESTILLPGVEARFYEGGKTWVGVVKDMGNDYAALVKSRDRMNAMKPKRNPSFHADQPRSAKVKCIETFGTKSTGFKPTSSSSSKKAQTVSTQDNSKLVSQNRQPSSKTTRLSPDQNQHPGKNQSNAEKNVKEKQLGKKEKTVTLSDGNSSDESLTEEELQVLAKLSQKRKRAELKELANLAVKVPDKNGNIDSILAKGSLPFGKPKKIRRNAIFDSDEEDNLNPNGTETLVEQDDKVPEKKDSPPVEKHKTADRVDSEGESSDDNKSKEKVSSPKLAKKHSRPKTRFVNPKPQFTGEYFLHKETDPGVVKLHQDHDVFIPEKIVKEVKRNSSINTTSALARFIVRQVFTNEALLECSVFGRPSACKGREAMVCRPALHEDGVKAIIKFVLERAEKKNWKSAVRSTVTAAMANIICENRDLMKLEDDKA